MSVPFKKTAILNVVIKVNPYSIQYIAQIYATHWKIFQKRCKARLDLISEIAFCFLISVFLIPTLQFFSQILLLIHIASSFPPSLWCEMACQAL